MGGAHVGGPTRSFPKAWLHAGVRKDRRFQVSLSESSNSQRRVPKVLKYPGSELPTGFSADALQTLRGTPVQPAISSGRGSSARGTQDSGLSKFESRRRQLFDMRLPQSGAIAKLRTRQAIEYNLLCTQPAKAVSSFRSLF